MNKYIRGYTLLDDLHQLLDVIQFFLHWGSIPRQITPLLSRSFSVWSSSITHALYLALISLQNEKQLSP